MRAVLIWCALSAMILLGALCLKSLPQHVQGAGLMAALTIATAIMFLKVCRGSK